MQAGSEWEILRKNSASLLFKHAEQVLTYTDLRVWDANGKILSARFLVHKNDVQIEVDAENVVYPVTIDPLVANGTPQNANTFLQSNQIGALMGFSVSGAGDVNGDGYDDVVIGAFVYDNGQTDEGAAFVHDGGSRGINPTTVANAGDINNDGFSDVIVGARNANNGQEYEGMAFFMNGQSAEGIALKDWILIIQHPYSC